MSADLTDAEREAVAFVTTGHPCGHENVRIFRSIPPHSKCLDCGSVVERRWVTKETESKTDEVRRG